MYKINKKNIKRTYILLNMCYDAKRREKIMKKIIQK